MPDSNIEQHSSDQSLPTQVKLTDSPSPSTLPQSTELPLSQAKKRLTKKRKPNSTGNHLTEREEGIAMGMRAVGVPVPKVARALEVKEGVIKRISNTESKQDVILEIRDKLKLTKMQKALLIEERLWNMVNDLINDKDAKGVDGAMRALHASEKIQQAVAGESQKIQVDDNRPPADLAGLIQILIQEKG